MRMLQHVTIWFSTCVSNSRSDSVSSLSALFHWSSVVCQNVGIKQNTGSVLQFWWNVTKIPQKFRKYYRKFVEREWEQYRFRRGIKYFKTDENNVKTILIWFLYQCIFITKFSLQSSQPSVIPSKCVKLTVGHSSKMTVSWARQADFAKLQCAFPYSAFSTAIFGQ